MRNLNFLRKSERKSVGTTLALTVGSPSVDRRYSALKHLTFMLLFLLGSLNVWGDPVEIYKNEGASGTTNGVTATGNVNTKSSNGNPGNSFANTTSSNTTFTFTGFSLSGYEGLSLSIDAKFASFPKTTETWPYVTITFSKNSTVVKTDNTTISWSSKGSSYSTYTIDNIPEFDKITIVCSPASGKNNSGNPSTSYACYMDNITLTGTASGGSTPSVKNVQFTPDGGSFLGSQSVTLSQEDSKAIYYTTNATLGEGDPSTDTWTAYSTPINLDATTTIYAAAKDGENWSSTTSKTFTKIEPLATMDAIFAAATSTATDKYITFSNTWVVTGVSTNGQTAYITDGTKGMILFNNSATALSPVGGLAVGNTLSGTKQCTLVLYGGAAEIKNFTADGLTKGNGDLPAVQELDATGISNLSAVNTGSLIKISGTVTQNETKYYVANVQLYNNLFSFTAPTLGSNYECTGVYVRYNSTNEICPRAAEDLVQETEKSQANTYWNDVASASLTIRANESVTALWSTESTGAKHFTSSVESVATIAADGAITIKGEGTTVLTYSTDENNDYYSGTATLTLTVKAALPAGATEFTWDATAPGYADQQILETVTASPNPIITFVKGGSNDNKWYNNGTAVRFYKDNSITFTAPEGKLLYQIEINFSVGNAQTLEPNVGEYNLAGTIGSWSGLAKSVVLANNAGAARITSIIVIYADGTETTLSIANVALKTTDGATDIVPTCNIDPIPTIEYSGNNVLVATITDGKITPVGIGSTVVTARIAQGSNYTAVETTFTITVSEKQLPALSFAEASYNASLGADFSEPELVNTNSVSPITYSSSVEAVATVNENSGAITLVGEGETVITAAFDGNGDYSANSAHYTLHVIDPNKDVLTAAGIGQASYGNWSKSFTTAIVYAGNSTTNVDRIQLRVSSGTQDPSGIVTTYTIGYLKSISAAAASGNTDGHKLQIYAKSTAYESAADLYDAEKRGTLIGTIAEDGGNIVFEEGKDYADHYKYIGIKSASGAVYYDDITIAWTPAVFEKYSVTYNAGEGSGENVVVSNIEEGTTIQLATKPEGFTYADHAFAGWKLDNAGETLAAGDDYEVNSNVTFVAQWSEAYTITYKAGEGTGDAVAVNNVAIGAYNLAGCPNTFTAPEGKIFAGWKLEDVEESTRAAGSSYTVAGSVAFVAQWLTANVVTFVSGTDKSESSPLIKSGITIAATTFNNDDYYQCYSGNTMTISSEVGDIIKIELTCTAEGSEKYGPGNFTLEGYSASSYTGIWSGSAETVNFGNASQQVRMTQIVVTYIPNGNVPKQPAGLSYETTSYVITQGNPFTAPTLNNPNGLVVTYSGNNDAVAIVDENSGAITLGGATGSVTITASAEEQGNYYAGTATYTLTINEPSDDLTGTWNLVTDAADLMAGMQVIVASVADGEGNLYTLGGPNGNSANNRLAVASTASGDVLNPEVGTKVITLVDAGNGKYALQLLNGKYLYAQGGTSSNYLKERSDINDQATWTITFEEGKAIIKADVSGRNWIRYNKDNNPKIFSCYASGQQDIALYAKQFDYTREIAQGVLSTTCLPNGGQIFGASIFEIAYMDYEADGTTPHKIYFDEVEGGIMEAGMPYVVLANEGAAKFGVYYTDSENKAAQNKNGLFGYIGAGRSLVADEYFIYDNKFFYVSADDATSGRIHISNNRAFIKLFKVPGYNNEPVSVPAPGRRRVSLGNGANAPTVATGFENTGFESEAPRKVLINGELFILRGEKMYDAKGQLVK